MQTAAIKGLLTPFDGLSASLNDDDWYDYASQLARYVASMKQNYGVKIYALSIQNEADFNTTNYESCVWTAQQLHDFVPYLSAAP